MSGLAMHDTAVRYATSHNGFSGVRHFATMHTAGATGADAAINMARMVGHVFGATLPDGATVTGVYVTATDALTGRVWTACVTERPLPESGSVHMHAGIHSACSPACVD